MATNKKRKSVVSEDYDESDRAPKRQRRGTEPKSADVKQDSKPAAAAVSTSTLAVGKKVNEPIKNTASRSSKKKVAAKGRSSTTGTKAKAAPVSASRRRAAAGSKHKKKQKARSVSTARVPCDSQECSPDRTAKSRMKRAAGLTACVIGALALATAVVVFTGAAMLEESGPVITSQHAPPKRHVKPVEPAAKARHSPSKPHADYVPPAVHEPVIDSCDHLMIEPGTRLTKQNIDNAYEKAKLKYRGDVDRLNAADVSYGIASAYTAGNEFVAWFNGQVSPDLYYTRQFHQQGVACLSKSPYTCK